MYSIQQMLRHAIVSACPLCGLKARGGDLCLGCAQELSSSRLGRHACEHCALSVKHASSLCRQCLVFRPAFDYTVTAMDYGYPGAMLIRALKERGQLAQANLFARMLAASLHQHPRALPRLRTLVPIPASRSSLRKRGFSPAAEIARALSSQVSLPLEQSWLKRTSESGVQKARDYTQRRNSVQGLYVCTRKVPPVWVGVVDDVMTSGSTMHEVARVLREAGALGVVAIVAARAKWRTESL